MRNSFATPRGYSRSVTVIPSHKYNSLGRTVLAGIPAYRVTLRPSVGGAISLDFDENVLLIDADGNTLTKAEAQIQAQAIFDQDPDGDGSGFNDFIAFVGSLAVVPDNPAGDPNEPSGILVVEPPPGNTTGGTINVSENDFLVGDGDDGDPGGTDNGFITGDDANNDSDPEGIVSNDGVPGAGNSKEVTSDVISESGGEGDVSRVTGGGIVLGIGQFLTPARASARALVQAAGPAYLSVIAASQMRRQRDNIPSPVSKLRFIEVLEGDPRFVSSPFDVDETYPVGRALAVLDGLSGNSKPPYEDFFLSGSESSDAISIAVTRSAVYTPTTTSVVGPFIYLSIGASNDDILRQSPITFSFNFEKVGSGAQGTVGPFSFSFQEANSVRFRLSPYEIVSSKPQYMPLVVGAYPTTVSITNVPDNARATVELPGSGSGIAATLRAMAEHPAYG